MPPASPPPSRQDRLFIGMSNLLFILSGLVILVCAAIFVNPALVPASMKPAAPSATPTSLPPVALSVPALSATSLATATSTQTFSPSPAPTRTLTPGDTATPSLTPTITPIPTATPIPSDTLTPTETPTATPTPTITPSQYLYTIQDGYPQYSAYPGGCQWLGFTGQVFDLSGQPVIDLVVHVGGVDYLTLSGVSQAYGIRGWVQKVADQPAASENYYTLQLQDLVGNPLSDSIVLTTSSSCAQNLITVNFIQNH
jgi:hypothetical protein